MIEYEKKIPLSAEEYNTLMEYSKDSAETIIQTNYYYDTDDYFMNNQGITCRIRSAQGKYIATIKDHICKDSEYSVENARPVTSETDDAFFANLGIKFQGNLVTERTKIRTNRGVTAVLDKNTYLETTDFELEVEYYSGCESIADQMIYELASLSGNDENEFLSRSKLAMSKSERFFERKKAIDNIR